MRQKGHLLAFLCWEIQRVDPALVLEVEVLVENENMVASFQILQPNFSPVGCFFSFPHGMNMPVSWGHW